MSEVICQLCEKPTPHVGPCDGFGYGGACSMCTEFIQRDDGTLIHDDGAIFAPVKEYTQNYYEVQLGLFPRKEVE